MMKGIGLRTPRPFCPLSLSGTFLAGSRGLIRAFPDGIFALGDLGLSRFLDFYVGDQVDLYQFG